MWLILWDKIFAMSLSRSPTCSYLYNCIYLQLISVLTNAHLAATNHPVWQYQEQGWAAPLYSGSEPNPAVLLHSYILGENLNHWKTVSGFSTFWGMQNI